MIIKNELDYSGLIAKLLQETLIALDVETEEFSSEKQYSFQLALDGIGVYASNSVKAFIPTKFLKPDFQQVLDKSEIIMHNAKFDLTILEKQGYEIENVKYHDTLIMSWLLNENRISHGLKELAKSVLKVQEVVEFKDVSPRPIKEDFGMFQSDYDGVYAEWLNELGKYCISDCKYTFKLFEKFKPRLEEQGIWNAYEKVELPMISVLMSMENRGIKLDKRYLIEIGDQMDQDIIQLQGEIWKEAGRQFDINSPKQLSEVLFKEKGYKLTDEFKTPTGVYSTNVNALNYLHRTYPNEILVQKILEYRELFKLQSTYIKGLLEKELNGCIHTSFKQHGTVTGRLSSSNPNLQQLPRRDDKYDIRKAFVPRAGYVFVISDLSQIELRVMAYLSQDPVMLDLFQKGSDIHQETADIIGCDRNVAKTVNFGISYGRSAFGMAKGLGISEKEAEKFINSYFSKFRRIKILIEQAKNTIKNKYAIQTILKRRRRFPDYAAARKAKNWKEISRIERQAINSIVQGSAADIIKVQMRNLYRRLKGFDAHILVQIHDELIVEVPKEKAEEVLKIVKHEMENAIKLKNVSIVAEPFISDMWKK